MIASLVDDYLAGRAPLRALQDTVNAIWAGEVIVPANERELADLLEILIAELTGGHIDEAALRSHLR